MNEELKETINGLLKRTYGIDYETYTNLTYEEQDNFKKNRRKQVDLEKKNNIRGKILICLRNKYKKEEYTWVGSGSNLIRIKKNCDIYDESKILDEKIDKICEEKNTAIRVRRKVR